MTADGVRRYVRFTADSRTAYGLRDGDSIRELEGDLFESPRPTGRVFKASEVRLGVPVDPNRVSKIIGVTGNFARPGQARRQMPHPRLFAKFASGLVPDGADVEVMPECHHIHHEGELVAVIGKKGRFVSVADAPGCVFGVAVGNDTWAPIGTDIVVGLDYNDLQMEIRQNGQVAARARTSEMLSSVAEVVSYMSAYMTLWPGDLIYMGTLNPNPDLREMKVGDVCEVEIEGIGVLRNRVVAMKGGLPLPTP